MARATHPVSIAFILNEIFRKHSNFRVVSPKYLEYFQNLISENDKILKIKNILNNNNKILQKPPSNYFNLI